MEELKLFEEIEKAFEEISQALNEIKKKQNEDPLVILSRLCTVYNHFKTDGGIIADGKIINTPKDFLEFAFEHIENIIKRNK